MDINFYEGYNQYYMKNILKDCISYIQYNFYHHTLQINMKQQLYPLLFI